jgi:uncharacterized protein
MTGTHPSPVVGVYDAPYWAFAEQSELRLQQCDACGTVRYPPGPRCAHCLSDRSTWTKLSGRGKVLGWTIFHRQYFPDLPVPYTVVNVETVEGPLLIGNLINAGDRSPEVGMSVRAVFQDVSTPDRTLRICQWEPDTPAEQRIVTRTGGQQTSGD